MAEEGEEAARSEGQPPSGLPGADGPIHEVPVDVDSFSQVRVREIGPSLELRQEWTRSWLALILVALLAAVVLLPLLFVYLDRWDPVKEWFQAALPAIVGLVGSAMGFYFGTRNTAGS